MICWLKHGVIKDDNRDIIRSDMMALGFIGIKIILI